MNNLQGQIYPNIYRDHNQSFGDYNRFNSDISAHLEECESLCENIINPPKEDSRQIKSQKPKTAIICYSLGYPSLYSPRYNIVNINNYGPSYNTSYGNRNNNNKDDTGQRVVIGLIGAAVAGAAVYLLGGFISERSRIVEELNKITDFKTKIEFEALLDPSHADLAGIKKVVDAEHSIFSGINAQADIKLALLVSAAVAGIFLTIGAIVASTPAMAVGGIVLFATMLGGLFNWSFSASNNNARKNAVAMNIALSALKGNKKSIPLTVSQAAPIVVEAAKPKTATVVPAAPVQHPAQKEVGFTFSAKAELSIP